MTDNAVSAPTSFDLDSPVMLHSLVFQVDGDEVTVGRRDIDSYAVLPADGGELVRRLVGGMTPNQAADWYQATYGEPVDVLDILLALDELGFVRTPDEPITKTAPVRGQWLSRVVFSPLAFACYGALVVWHLVAMSGSHDLTPSFRNLFFNDANSIVLLGLLLGQVPGLFLHEGFHAIAGRRLGLRSSLTVSRRLYYVVLETSMDSLVTVPRRQRYLPILAGMIADLAWVSTLTLVAEYSRSADGGLSGLGKLCLALAFSTLLRFFWQFFFYLRTDLYALICVVFGCIDLHTVARRTLRNRFNRLFGRQPRHDETQWYPQDRSVARWYSWLIVLGYTFAIGSLTLAVLPAAYELFSRVLGKLRPDADSTTLQVFDSVTVLVVISIQLCLVTLVVLRDRRRQAESRHLHHVIG